MEIINEGRFTDNYFLYAGLEEKPRRQYIRQQAVLIDSSLYSTHLLFIIQHLHYRCTVHEAEILLPLCRNKRDEGVSVVILSRQSTGLSHGEIRWN